MTIAFEQIAQEISRLEKRLCGYRKEFPEASLLPARWVLAGRCLRWHVHLSEEILEPDLDFEITSNALIVRALPTRRKSKLLLAVLPIPGLFDLQNPEIHCQADSIEISVKYVKGESR